MCAFSHEFLFSSVYWLNLFSVFDIPSDINFFKLVCFHFTKIISNNIWYQCMIKCTLLELFVVQVIFVFFSLKNAICLRIFRTTRVWIECLHFPAWTSVPGFTLVSVFAIISSSRGHKKFKNEVFFIDLFYLITACVTKCCLKQNNLPWYAS